jgi:hypothetical protein
VFKIENMENGVTVTLGKQNYNSQPFSLADTIRGGKEIRKALQKVPRVKAKMMVSKMMGKRWEPLFKTTSVGGSVPYQHTFQLKPFNF